MAFDPLPHGRGFVDTVVTHDHRDTGDPWSWIGVIQQCQQVTEERMGFSVAAAIEYGASGEIQGASEVVLRVLAGGHDCLLGPFGYPGRADLGQQVDIELIGNNHRLMHLPQLTMKSNTGQAFDPLWIIILGNQLRPFPYLIHLVEPAAYSPCRYFNPEFSLEFYGHRSPTPACAIPAIGTRCGHEQHLQRTPEPRAQDSCMYGRRDLAVWVERKA
jgi:hypothetical protein